MRIALIGATGLTGRSLVPLLAEKHDLLLLGRRSANVGAARERIAPMHDWPALLEAERLDVAISCLGSTMRKAGSWPAFVAVDRDAVLGFARAAKDAGARQLVTMSSVGADPLSRAPYLALKGEVEHALAEIGFDRLDVLRPGLLRGKRGPDRRPAERLGILLSRFTNPLMLGPLDRFAAIDVSTVAAAIAALAGTSEPGIFCHCNREIRALAACAG